MTINQLKLTLLNLNQEILILLIKFPKWLLKNFKKEFIIMKKIIKLLQKMNMKILDLYNILIWVNKLMFKKLKVKIKLKY